MPPQTPGRSTTSGRGRGSGSDMAKGMSQASWGLSVAFGFVATVMVGWGIGRLLDAWLGTEPWIQVTGAVIGWVGGVFVVYYAAQRPQP